MKSTQPVVDMNELLTLRLREAQKDGRWSRTKEASARERMEAAKRKAIEESVKAGDAASSGGLFGFLGSAFGPISVLIQPFVGALGLGKQSDQNDHAIATKRSDLSAQIAERSAGDASQAKQSAQEAAKAAGQSLGELRDAERRRAEWV
jgi:hypothetical protein